MFFHFFAQGEGRYRTLNRAARKIQNRTSYSLKEQKKGGDEEIWLFRFSLNVSSWLTPFTSFHACTLHDKLPAEDTTHVVFVSCYSLIPSSAFILLYISLSIGSFLRGRFRNVQTRHWFLCSYSLSFGRVSGPIIFFLEDEAHSNGPSILIT